MRTANTTGNQITDEELDLLDKRLRLLEQSVSANANTPATPPVVTPAPSVMSATITVSNVSGMYSQTVTGLTVGDNAGLQAAANGDGTSLLTNTGVLSWNGLTGAVTYTPPATGLQVASTITGSSTLTVPSTSGTVYPVDASGGTVTITLPAGSTAANKVFYIKKIDATANAVTVVMSGTDTTDGVASKSITTQWADMHIIGYSGGYYIL